MRIVVGAAMSVPPFAPGMTWDRLHYVLGFRALGHDVCFVEEVSPKSCVDRAGRPAPYETSMNRAHFIRTMRRFGLLPHACQIFDGGKATAGMDLASMRAAVQGAELLINISGHVRSPLVLEGVNRRAYLDADPVYTQLWQAEYGADVRLQAHDVWFSVGLNIGTPNSPVPDCGLTWHPFPPIVAVEHWQPRVDPNCQRFTTVATWGRYADLTYQGRLYASKREQFRRLAPLARRSRQPLEVALPAADINELEARLLSRDGWIVTDASTFAGLSEYQDFISTSRAEIGVAKGAYVTGRSGWFSDRSCHYLASGKPVLAQSTGGEAHLPIGEGLLTFCDVDEAVAGIERINLDYLAHCRAARRVAEKYFDYRRVLPPIVELAMS